MPVKALMLSLIRGYRLLISPFTFSCCRFHPSCSQYALDAVETHGAAKGFWLTLKRLAKCHPFHPGGFDPVPQSQAMTGKNRWNREHSSR